MLIREMSRQECIDLVAENHIARLGCARDGRPYVVPVQYAFAANRLYGFSMPGQKIDWMRANPRVCIQLDTVTDRQAWRSVVIYGRYQELPDTKQWHRERLNAWALLEQRVNWWEPGGLKPGDQAIAGASPHLFFEIEIDEVINRFASDVAADLIVMGAYGHSRMRERVFGGVTRSMLENAVVPVLMAH